MMLNNLSLKWKGVLIVLFCLSGMFLQQYFSITEARDAMLQEKRIKLQEVIKTAYDIVKIEASRAEKGLITEEEAKREAAALLRDVRYNAKNDYFFVYQYDGTNVALGPRPDFEGKNKIDLVDPNGLRFVEALINAAKKGGDFVSYMWERDKVLVPKLSYAVGYEPWKWMIGTGIYIDDVDEAFYKNIKTSIQITLMLILIVAGFTLYVIRSIVVPILATSDQMTKIADKQDVAITGIERKDELGTMAQTLSKLKYAVEEQRRLEKELAEAEARKMKDHKAAMSRLADQLEAQVGTVVLTVEKEALDMQKMAATLAAASEETTRQSSSVASSSGLASSNVQTVAAASEELSASIRELVTNVSNTAKATRACSESAKVSQDYLGVLHKSVEEIDMVIKAINDVAEQTNLLALNATIEAARAGEAGRGFAVVANEVKTLAGETNKMTEEIAEKVNTIKTSAKDTINSVSDIVSQVSSIDNMTTSISSAIEEQNASTSEISRSANEAANFTSEVSNSISQVQDAAKDAAAATNGLKSASDSLLKQSIGLKETVDKFVKEVRNS